MQHHRVGVGQRAECGVDAGKHARIEEPGCGDRPDRTLGPHLGMQCHVEMTRELIEGWLASGAEQGEDRIHVVLVGLGMVGVADVHPHRQAQQLAAEMILQRRAQDLLAVVQILRTDEADDRVHQKRIELARHGVGAWARWGWGCSSASPAAREAMALASFYAGLAFTKAYVGYVHAFSHKLGGMYGVPHGLANAITLALASVILTMKLRYG